MSAIEAILQRVKEVARNGERLAYVGLPPEEWKALLAELRQVARYDHGQSQEDKDLGIPAPWERPDPDTITLHSAFGPVEVAETPQLVLSCPSYAITLTGIS